MKPPPPKDDDSWLSLGCLGAVIYWGFFLLLRVLDASPSYGLVYFVVGTFVLIRLVKIGKKILLKKWLGIFPVTFEEEHKVGKSSDKSLPFFVQGQVRRRKLDLTRSSNVISDSVGTKIKRQRQGIFGSKKKRRKRG